MSFGQQRRLRLVYALVATGSLAALAAPTAQSSIDWTPPIDVQTPAGDPVAFIHSSVLPTGHVLLVGGTPDIMHAPITFELTPPRIGEWMPPRTVVNALPAPYAMPWPGLALGNLRVWDSLFCGGQTLLADGRIFAAGGMAFHDERPVSFAFSGLPWAYVFSPQTSTWSPKKIGLVGVGGKGTMMAWYPTTVRMPDGDVLVVAGTEGAVFVPGPRQYWSNRSVTRYSPGTESWETLSTHDQTPEYVSSDEYTHAFVLPKPTYDGDVLMFGARGRPVLFDSLRKRWSISPHDRPGWSMANMEPNEAASSALLPIRTIDGEWGYRNGSVAVVGEDTFDVYDPVADAWKESLPLGVHRHFPDAVLLPDGRVLVVNGTNDIGDMNGARVQYYDPRTKSLAWGASNAELRGYHNVASLLPDGRVLIGSGQRPGPDGFSGNELTSLRYFLPDYMFKPRPRITGIFVDPFGHMGTTLRYGRPYSLSWIGLSPVTEVVLVGLSTMTHSFDTNQRHIQLPVFRTLKAGDLNLVLFGGPLSAQIAPPGHYILFGLDEHRVPSPGVIVQITS